MSLHIIVDSIVVPSITRNGLLFDYIFFTFFTDGLLFFPQFNSKKT